MKRSLSLRLATLAGAAAGLALSATASAQYAISTSIAGTFTDISGSGGPIVIGDDSSAPATVSAAAANVAFPAGTIGVCTNGHVGYGVDTQYFNFAIPSGNFYGGGTAAALYFDDLITHATGAGVYVQEIVQGGVPVLIIQWNVMDHYFSSSSTGTFELKIYGGGTGTTGTGPGGCFAQYLYQDVDFGDPANYNNGVSATIGFQVTGTAGVQYSLDTASIQNGAVLSLVTEGSGACCLPDGSCSILGTTACGQQGGVFQGNGSICGTCPQPGACCIPSTLTCSFISQPACDSAGGTFRGVGTSCATANCPTPGACCLQDGTCVQATPASCATQSGIYRGDSTACASANCPQPGACCAADGTCSVLSEGQCATAGGVYRGNGTACATANCPQPGACCQTDGLCVILQAPGCSAISGIYRGDGTSCATANCPLPPGVWVEVGDAGDFTETANVTVGSGPLNTIRGQIGDGNDADMYRFAICDIANFSAVTCGLANVDTQLFLFDANGVGVVGDDDYCGVQSTINNSTGCLNSASNSIYFLAVSSYNNDPTSAGTLIFTSAPFGVIYCPNIFTPMDAWTGGGGTGPYSVALTGACFDHASGPACYANCDTSTQQPCLNVLDFTCFLNSFAASSTYANCDASTQPPVLNVLDFTCFLNRFAAGCSGC